MAQNTFRHFCCSTLIAMAFACLPAYALETAPAPEGDAIAVAGKVIGDNFEKIDCDSVVKAERQNDGSIKAECRNGETFRVFVIVELGKPVALKCSAAEALGIPGC